MSLMDELRAEAQPGYEQPVANAVEFLHEHLGGVIFEGVDKDAFADGVLEAVLACATSPEHKLLCLRSLGALAWWCDLKLPDAFQGRLAAGGRSICRKVADTVQVRMHRAHPDALKAHAVFVGDLAGLYHSPTLGAIEYVRALLSDPEVERVVVFHSGVLYAAVEALARSRWSADAERLQLVSTSDRNYLNQAIQEGPFTYHFWCEPQLALHIGLLSLFGPSVMFTCADAAPAQFADVYWYCHDETYIEGLWRRQGAPRAFAANYRRTESAPFERPAPRRPRARAELGFAPDDTVIVTVGNRLGVEMDQSFVDGMGALLVARPHAKWLMIGKLQDFWRDAFQSVLGPQFAHVDYDTDLAGLMGVTDIFANPFRAGGGNSALVAIDAGCAVVTRSDVGDVGAFVPAAHKADSSEAYFAEMAALIDTPALRAARLAEQQALLARRLDLDLFAEELKALRHLAYRRFAKRLPVKLSTIFPGEPPQARLRTG